MHSWHNAKLNYNEELDPYDPFLLMKNTEKEPTYYEIIFIENNIRYRYPETPDFIHNMIQNEVAKQLADNKAANLRRRKRWTAPKVAAVAAACALAVSTAVYAGVNLYHWFLEKQGYILVNPAFAILGNSALISL